MIELDLLPLPVSIEEAFDFGDGFDDGLSSREIKLLKEQFGRVLLGLGADDEYRLFNCPMAGIASVNGKDDGWGNPAPGDPLTLHFCIPTTQEEPLVFEATLREIILHEFIGEQTENGATIHRDHDDDRNKIVAALRDLISDIEAWKLREKEDLEDK